MKGNTATKEGLTASTTAARQQEKETEMINDEKQGAKVVVANADNENLMPWGGNGIVVGYVDRVNGRGAEETEGFTSTRDELIQLVKYWYGVDLRNRWFFFLFTGTGSTEWRESAFANLRIARLEKVLGREDVEKAIAETKEEFAKAVSPEHWEIFLHGNEAQWAAVQDQIQRELDNAAQGETKPAA